MTGIIVSDKLNVTKKYVREIRSLLYIWEKYGYSATMAKFLPKYKAEKGHVKKGNPDLTNVLDGKLMYLKMVKYVIMKFVVSHVNTVITSISQ